MVGDVFGSRFDGSVWFWVVLGPDLVVGVLDFICWKWFWIQISLFWAVTGGSGSRSSGWGR